MVGNDELEPPESQNPRELLLRELADLAKWMCQQQETDYSTTLVRKWGYHKWSAPESHHYEKLGRWKEEEYTLEELLHGYGHPTSDGERLKLQILADVLAPVTTSTWEVIIPLLSVYHSTRENQLLLYEVVKEVSRALHYGYPPTLFSSLPDKLKERDSFKEKAAEATRFSKLLTNHPGDPWYYATVACADRDEIKVEDLLHSWERDMGMWYTSDFCDVDEFWSSILEQRLKDAKISEEAINIARRSLLLCTDLETALKFPWVGQDEKLKQKLDNLPFFKDKPDFANAENFARFLRILKYQDRHGGNLSRTTAENELWECAYLKRELGKSVDLVTHFMGGGGNRQCYGAIKRESDDSEERRLVVSVMKTGRIRRDAANNEVNALFRLDHPSIVKYLGNGILEDGRPYIITKKFGDGETLYSFLEKHQRPLTLREFLTVFYGGGRGVVDALVYAHGEQDPHRVKVYHGDCSPRNILLQLDEQGDVLETKIADWESTMFGSDSKKVKPHSSLGSSAYTLPGSVGASAEGDRFSLAITMYVALTGTHPLLKKPVCEIKNNGDKHRRQETLREMTAAYKEWKTKGSTLRQKAHEIIREQIGTPLRRPAHFSQESYEVVQERVGKSILHPTQEVFVDCIMGAIDNPQQTSLTYIYHSVKSVYNRPSG